MYLALNPRYTWGARQGGFRAGIGALGKRRISAALPGIEQPTDPTVAYSLYKKTKQPNLLLLNVLSVQFVQGRDKG
jgi:hypothetical protein